MDIYYIIYIIPIVAIATIATFYNCFEVNLLKRKLFPSLDSIVQNTISYSAFSSFNAVLFSLFIQSKDEMDLKLNFI
jgi:hypothetical protein